MVRKRLLSASVTPDRGGRPVAIVTGAARGIGRASALALGRRGFAVALVDRLEPELGEAVAAVRALGVEPLPLLGDVADFARTQELGHRVLDTWGRADVLVNNADVSQPKGLVEITEADWDRSILPRLPSDVGLVDRTCIRRP